MAAQGKTAAQRQAELERERMRLAKGPMVSGQSSTTKDPNALDVQRQQDEAANQRLGLQMGAEQERFGQTLDFKREQMGQEAELARQKNLWDAMQAEKERQQEVSDARTGHNRDIQRDWLKERAKAIRQATFGDDDRGTSTPRDQAFDQAEGAADTAVAPPPDPMQQVNNLFPEGGYTQYTEQEPQEREWTRDWFKKRRDERQRLGLAPVPGPSSR